MPKLLKQLELEELSLVDRPANAKAMVSLFKRDNSNGEDMDYEVDKAMDPKLKDKLKPYMDKGMSEEEAKKAYDMDQKKKMHGKDKDQMKKSDEELGLELEIEHLQSENEMLKSALIKNDFIIKSDTVEKKVEPVYVEYAGEKINKADIPAPILKALEEAEAERADAALTKKAEEALPNFDVEVAKSLIATFEDNTSVMEALKGADAVYKGSMEEIGKSDADGNFSSAEGKMEALVKAYMEKHSMSKGQYAIAYTEVAKTDEGRELVMKSYKGE